MKNKIKKGDLLLVKYKIDPIGWLIRLYTKSEYNHIAFILNKNFIIESCRHGIIKSSIKKYSNKFLYKTKIIRVKNISEKEIKKISLLLLNNLRKSNYFKQIFTFILLFFKYEGILPRPTCSGVIAKAFYKCARIKFKNKKLNLITPGDIEKSKKVYEINIKNT